jgi:CrcB protein
METWPVVPFLLIGIGGFFGAIARYTIDNRLTTWTGDALPWGTFAINMTGSFAAGLLFALIVERTSLPADLRGPVLVGFLGSYTTFSTWTLESWRMIDDGAWLSAALTLGGSMVIGVVAIMAGVAIGRAM